ncbi:hypothetical protein [Halobacteriovorax sp. HLS]|uniref:hypothetical protein n=1 Tax=Halobacteriovorax sp. HLS TaxID=2234000 RepID=UPI000FD9A48E|nr:hypothetical protein [Halobacteriovorax sp. HLS]
MKIVSFLLFAFSSTILANTNFSLEPQVAASCKIEKFKTINYIVNTKKIETTQDLEISFTTFYGNCLDGKFNIRPVSRNLALNIFKEGINTPWSYTPSQEVEYVNDTMARVTLTIDKDIVFSKKNKREYSIVIYPSSSKRNSFNWKLKLDYDEKLDITKVNIIK